MTVQDLYVGAIHEPRTWKPSLYGLGIGAFIAAIIFLRSSLYGSGYLTADSMNYLALAQSLNQGHGFTIPNEGYFPAGLEYFATWPVGYPFIIHLVSKLADLSPFMASKTVNMLAVTSCTVMVATACGRKGAILALPFAFAAGLDIFSYSWSEAPFIFFLVSAMILFAGLIGKPDKTDIGRSLLLAACCLGLFLTRYVGAFAIALIGLVVLVALLRRNFYLAFLNGFLWLAVAGTIWLYLHNNAALTGYSTGMPRTPPTDSAMDRLAMLVGALGRETIFPVSESVPGYRVDQPDTATGIVWLAGLAQLCGLAGLTALVRRRYQHPLRELRLDSLALSSFVVGSLYLAAIISLRWLNQFDPYNYRLLWPGTLLIVIAMLRVALLSWPRAGAAITGFAAALSAVSVALAIVPLASASGAGYRATISAVEHRYESVAPGTIIVFGDDRLRYVRADLFVAEPMCQPWFDEDESWGQFLSEIDHRHPILVDMAGHALKSADCQKSVQAFLTGHKAGELFPLALPDGYRAAVR